MESALRKIVIFLALIAFLLSSIIGLVSGFSVTTILMRSFIAFAFFAATGLAMVPVFAKFWNETAPTEHEYDSYGEEDTESEQDSTE